MADKTLSQKIAAAAMAVTSLANIGAAQGATDQEVHEQNLEDNSNAATMQADGNNTMDHDQRLAELEAELTPSISYLAQEHGTESGCFTLEVDADDGEKYMQYDFSSFDADMPEKLAAHACDTAVVDFATQADLDHLENTGEKVAQNVSLEDFKVDLTQGLDESLDLRANISGPTIGDANPDFDNSIATSADYGDVEVDVSLQTDANPLAAPGTEKIESNIGTEYTPDESPIEPDYNFGPAVDDDDLGR